MIEPQVAPISPDAVVEVPPASVDVDRTPRIPWEARLDLAQRRAETERLRVPIEFLGRPVHAPGANDHDPDVLSAYNLAIEAALNEVRRAALGR